MVAAPASPERAKTLTNPSNPSLPAPLALWGGAECTVNRVGGRFTDQLRLSGHLQRASDLERFASLGIAALRYPLLWETFAHCADPARLWAWHAARLERLRELGVKPVIGLIHHGSGPRGTGLLAPDFARGLAAHAAAAARLFPWVHDWTPVNEPLTTARFAALYGHWHPHRRDERSFWQAVLNQVEAVRLAMTEIRAINPAARLVQTEDLGRTDATDERRVQADYDNIRRWATWDLLAGRLDRSHPFWPRLAAMGLYGRLAVFAENPCPPDLLGLNHYLTSDRYLDHRVERYPPAVVGHCPAGPLADTETVRALGASPGLEGALRETWDRYGIPIAITEVHNGCTREEQMRWLDEAWTTASRLRAEGVAIEAVTAWSLLGAHDWDSLLTRTAGHYESGVFDIRAAVPRETALAPMLRAFARGERLDHPVLSKGGWWRGHRERSATPDDHHPPLRRPLLIVGATGTLGRAFAAACGQRGIDHIALSRAQMDLCDAASIASCLDAHRPWAVINCAGWVRVDDAEAHQAQCLAVNYDGSIALASACAQRAIHYSCFSSDLVFDGLGGRAYRESDAPAPLGVYGRSKALADAAMLGSGLPSLILRTASFFSPFDEHNFAVQLVSALRVGEGFAAATDCVTSPTYVPDLVDAALDLVIDNAQGLWHLVNAGATSWAAFGADIAAALDLPLAKFEGRPASAMGWCAPRPPFAPLASERAHIMPSLENAIERFSRELSVRPA